MKKISIRVRVSQSACHIASKPISCAMARFAFFREERICLENFDTPFVYDLAWELEGFTRSGGS
jgi:hypothetical protein